MLGDINRNLEPMEYELILCKPDKTQISVLNANNIEYISRFPTTDELSFSINCDEIYYNLVIGDYLILLNNEKYFMIDNPNEIGDGKEVKNIHCYSLEYMLTKKLIRSYKLVSRKLYSLTNELDSDGYQLGVMNYVTTSLTTWTLDINSFSVFSGLNSTYRQFDISEKTLFEFLINDVQNAYKCIFFFDTVNRKISVKSIADLQSNKGFYLSEENYIKKINKTIKNDEIITRLYCYGNDISINDINTSGTSYIENYTFYKTTEFMSQELINALNSYEVNLDNNSTVFSSLLDNLNVLQEEYTTLNNDLATSNVNLKIAQDAVDVAIKNNTSLTALNVTLSNAEIDVLIKQAQLDVTLIDSDLRAKHPQPNPNLTIITSKQSQINAKNLEIQNLRISLDINNYLTTQKMLDDFDYFVKERTWSDSSYIESADLLNDGKDMLLKLSTPPLLFDIEVLDFLQIIECQHDWNKLVNGDLVNVEFSKFDVDINVRLVGYTHRPQENSLKLNFSNKDSIDDPSIYLKDLIKNAITSSNTLNMNKTDWDNKVNPSVITELRNENIDATSKQILASKNQSQIIDKRGIWLTEKDESGTVSPEQLRMINNAIVISRDNFQTASLAITPLGIANEKIKFAKIILQ